MEDSLSLLMKGLLRRKLCIAIFVCCSVALGVVFTSESPKEYTSQVKMLQAVALRDCVIGEDETGDSILLERVRRGEYKVRNVAIPLNVYTEVISSDLFMLELFDVEVETADGALKTNLYTYMRYYQQQAWWKGPKKIEVPSYVDVSEFDISTLTTEQRAVCGALRSRISVYHVKQSSSIRIVVKMQDAKIAQMVADQVMVALTEVITENCTFKARQDYTYAKKELAKAQEWYKLLQEEKAGEFEIELAQKIYERRALYLERAKDKIQTNTPIFNVLETAVKPVVGMASNRFQKLYMIALASFIFSVLFVVVKDKLFR